MAHEKTCGDEMLGGGRISGDAPDAGGMTTPFGFG